MTAHSGSDKSPADSCSSESQGPPRVLVVDDHADFVSTISTLLRRAQWDLRCAYEGQAALREVLDFRPHVITLDIGLPNMDGYAVARAIRLHAALSAVPIVAVTGYDTESHRQRCLREGFSHFFAKPVKFKQLNEVLRKLANDYRRLNP